METMKAVFSLAEPIEEIVRHFYNLTDDEILMNDNEEFRSTNLNRYQTYASVSAWSNFIQFLSSVNSAFPDYKITMNRILMNGDEAMVFYNIQGTNKEKFMGMPPTNKSMNVVCLDVLRINSGQVLELKNIACQVNAFSTFKFDTVTSKTANLKAE